MYLWFRLHLMFQVVGFVLMIAGFAVAWHHFPDPAPDDYNRKTLHQALGTLTCALASLQVCAAALFLFAAYIMLQILFILLRERP